MILYEYLFDIYIKYQLVYKNLNYNIEISKFIKKEYELNLEYELQKLIKKKQKEFKDKFDRHVPIQDLFSNRWDTAKFCGFGKGSSCYNNVLVIGKVTVGENSWIGPNVILDGSGELEIGDYASISAGVQIYTHSSVNWSTSMGQEKIKYKTTTIGDGVYIGPNSILEMGINIGDKAVIGAMSFVNQDIPPSHKFYGNKLFKQDK